MKDRQRAGAATRLGWIIKGIDRRQAIAHMIDNRDREQSFANTQFHHEAVDP